jgi:hypothetical protein
MASVDDDLLCDLQRLSDAGAPPPWRRSERRKPRGGTSILPGLVLVVTLAAAMAACATPQPADAVVLRTRVPSSPEACPMARTEGTLVRHPQSGAGLRDDAGAQWQVIWPPDYTARDEGGRLAVRDAGGKVIAREGDRVEIGGQDVGGGTWLGCGGMSVVIP